jgi:MFS family permease
VTQTRERLRGERALYYAAKFVGQVAQNLLLAALFLIAGASSHAAIGLSSLFIAMLVPAILFGFLGGAFVDRIGPARGFVAGSVLRLAAVIAGVLFLHGSGSAWILAFVYTSVSQVGGPAEMALVKTLRGRATGRAHSVIVALQYGGQGVGMFVLAPALYYLAGPHAILAGSAVGFVLLVVMASVLTLRLRATPAVQTQPARSAFSFMETVRFFRREALARDAITVLSIKAMVAQGVVVTLPLYLKHDMGLGNHALAFLLLPGVAGIVAGLVWAGRARLTPDRCRETMRLALLGMIASVLALAALDLSISIVAEYSHVPPIAELAVSMNTTFAVALPVAFLLGASLSASLVAARVVLTDRAPLGQQARVFAVQATLTDALVVLPLLLLGVGAQFAGARPTLAAIGLIGAVAFLLIEHPRFRPQPALRSLPIAVAAEA